MDRTLIANTSIFEGSGATPYVGDVLVEGSRIAAVQRGGGLPRGDARVIDGAGATLMPGLIEPHGHVSYPDAPSNAAFTRLPPEEPGYLADLLLVDGETLADVKRLQNRDALLAIMKDGHLHKAPRAA